MTSVQPVLKSNLHRSMFPNQSFSHNTSSPVIMRHSTMDQRINQSFSAEVKNTNISYKYERVGNIFKLVQLKSNNSDPKQQTIFQNNQIQKINDALQDLTNRIISLQLQQAKIPGFERKLNESLVQINNFSTQYSSLSDKIKNATKQIIDFKERLQQVEEHRGSYQNPMSSFIRSLDQIKIGNIQNQKKYQNLAENIKEQIQKQIFTLRNQLFQQQNPQKIQTKVQSKLLIRKIKSDEIKPKTYTLKYRQTYEYEQSVYSINEIKYLVDSEGRLLDSSGFIILDSNNKQIKLSEKHIAKLNDFGILS